MDPTKLDYSLTNPHPTTMVKNQEHQVFFSVSAMSSHFHPNSFDFGPLSNSAAQPPYPYPSPSDIPSSSDQHPASFSQSQQAPPTDVTTYLYHSESSSYPQPSHSSYQLSSGHEAFNEDLTPHSVSLSLNSSLGLAIQTPAAPFSSVPSDYTAVRRYHQDQSRQHAQVLHQLTQSRDRRRQSTTEHANGNGVLSASLEITPTGRKAEFYHASSIPMSNTRLHQPRPPEYPSHHLQHSQQSNQYQYPYYHNRDLVNGYPDAKPPDGSTTQVLTSQGMGIYESAQQQPTSAFPLPIKAGHIPSPPATNSTIAHESTVYTMCSGPQSNPIRSISQPSTHSFEETTGTSRVHPTASDVAPITPPPPALTNGNDNEDAPSGIALDGSHLIEIESEDEEKLTSEQCPLKEDVGTANVVSNQSGSAKRRDRKQTEGSGATGIRGTSDSKTSSIIKDGSSPPTKKRKKSKMHECGICHKNFPRPSGLKTHMNTHNNERPYPCPFPGCNRNFGVRSNAKRHLRTHGVIPPQNTGTQPYVVDFSTPMVLEQDDRLGLNGEGTGSCNEDDDRPEHTQRPARSGRGRGRQFKLRWMPPSSSTRSGVVKGKGKKKRTDSPSVEPVEMRDHGNVKPSLSRSPSQRNRFLGRGEEDPEREDAEGEGEDADGNTDGEEDIEMDFGDEGDEDEESEAEDVDRSEEEFGASTTMQAGDTRLRPGSSQHSQASSSRTSLSSSLSATLSTSTGSTSVTSLPPSASSSSLTSASPIGAEYFVKSIR